MIIWRRVACWVCKATRAEAHARARVPTKHTTHTQEYLILETGVSCYNFRSTFFYGATTVCIGTALMHNVTHIIAL